MPILATFMNFCDLYDFRKVVANAFLGDPLFSFSLLKKNLFSSHTNLCFAKLNLGYKLKDFPAMLQILRLPTEDRGLFVELSYECIKHYQVYVESKKLSHVKEVRNYSMLKVRANTGYEKEN